MLAQPRKLLAARAEKTLGRPRFSGRATHFRVFEAACGYQWLISCVGERPPVISIVIVLGG
jgi:hypothetical protein